MEKKKKYKISLFAEFTDKSLENEFLADIRSNSAKITAYIALVFGLYYYCFWLAIIFLLSSLLSSPFIFETCNYQEPVFLISLVVFFVAQRIKNSSNLMHLITAYQTIIAITYLLSLKEFETLNYFSFIGLMVISLGIYLLPNKIMFSQLVSIIFSILFFFTLPKR